MSLITNKGKEVKEELNIDEFTRGEMLAKDFRKHLEDYHTLQEVRDNDIDVSILEDELNAIQNPKKLNFTRGLITFSPSSASKCERELFFKATKAEKDEQIMYPYQRRWVRNGTAVHSAIQKDLLYAEKHLKDPKFKVVRMKAPESVAGRPAWEHNVKNVKPFPNRGFQLFGMMDGILEYTPDGSKIGFEFKTKSTTIATVGNFKMRGPQEGHVEQVTAYSILFGIDEFLLCYESVAKDGWMKGEEARDDVRVFYVKVTQEDRDRLLEKFDRVVEAVSDGEIPEGDPSKHIFCEYKSICGCNGGRR